jgi:hydroxymethylglutaryl-CoA lyase
VIQIVEVGPRDGLQSEEAVLPVPTRVDLIRRLAAAGAGRIETVSFAHPDLVPQMAGAEEICAALDDRSFSAIGLVLNRRGLERALECDLDEVNLVAYASDGYAEKNSGAAAEERNAEVQSLIEPAAASGLSVSVTISVAFGDPVEGPVTTERVAGIAADMADAGAAEISLGDTIGVAAPPQVARTVQAVRASTGAARLRCHFHNTRNTGYANAVAAIDAGVDALDSSVGGYGGSPFSPGAGGNLATEDLTSMLTAMGVEHAVDTAEVTAVGVWLAQRLGHDQPPAMLARAAPWPP